jgi:hypothetical protein
MMTPNALAGKRIAFVVGINQYEHLGDDRQLTNAINDAHSVAKELGNLGFNVIPAEDATRSEFNSKWQDILDTIKPDDTLVFYFSGHGVQIEGQNFLLPSDIPYIKFGRQEQIKRESISLSEMLLDLKTGDRKPPRITLMILDACRDNPLIPPGYKSVAHQGGLANIAPPEGTFIMYSAAAGQVSLDRLGEDDTAKNSVYTRTLLPLMEKPGLTLPALAQEVRRQVSKLAKSVGEKQQPAYFDQLNGAFCLVRCAADAWGYLVDLQTSLVYTLKKDKVEVGGGWAKNAGIKNDISFESKYISRRHLMFHDNLSVEDLRSTNGTTVNGTFLPYGVVHKLADGDLLSLANVKVVRFSKTPPRSITPPPSDAWAILINSDPKGYKYLTKPEYSLQLVDGVVSLEEGNSDNGLLKIRWSQGKGAEMLDVRGKWDVAMTVKDSDYDYNLYPFPKVNKWTEAQTIPLRFVKLSEDHRKVVEELPAFQLIMIHGSR